MSTSIATITFKLIDIEWDIITLQCRVHYTWSVSGTDTHPQVTEWFVPDADDEIDPADWWKHGSTNAGE